MSWRKNIYRRNTIRRFGITIGLPLFEQSAPEYIQKRIKMVPKAIYVADETRKLSEIAAKIDEIKLSQRQQQVLDKMYKRDNWSFQELSEALEWTVNRVIPRVFELRQMGLVEPAPKRQCTKTKMLITPWRVK
jgi:hypothetical protein